MARQSGLLHPTDFGPLHSDTVHHFVSTGALAVYQADLPPSGNNALPVAKYCEIKSDSECWISFGTTGAITPTSNLTTQPSTAPVLEHVLANFPLWRQIPGGSTGYTIAFDSSAYASVTLWGP